MTKPRTASCAPAPQKPTKAFVKTFWRRLNRSSLTHITIPLPFALISKRPLPPKSNMNLLLRFTLALLVCSWRCAPAASALATK